MSLTTSQIAYIIIALVVLAVLIYVFIFLGYRPFETGTQYGKCTNITRDYCLQQRYSQKCWEDFGCEGSI